MATRRGGFAGATIDPVHRAEYQSNGIPRPGELSVQRKSIRGSTRVNLGAPSSRLLSKYSPFNPARDSRADGRRRNSEGTVTKSRTARPGPGAYPTSMRPRCRRLSTIEMGETPFEL